MKRSYMAMILYLQSFSSQEKVRGITVCPTEHLTERSSVFFFCSITHSQYCNLENIGVIFIHFGSQTR